MHTNWVSFNPTTAIYAAMTTTLLASTVRCTGCRSTKLQCKIVSVEYLQLRLEQAVVNKGVAVL